jgi:hypothetical protein
MGGGGGGFAHNPLRQKDVAQCRFVEQGSPLHLIVGTEDKDEQFKLLLQ